MQNKRAQCSIVRVWQIVDLLMQGIAPGTFVLDSSSIDESVVRPASEEWVWQVTEELLEQCGHRVDIVVEIGRVAEVEVRGIVVESVAQGVDVRCCAGRSVDSFDVEPEEVDSLHALVDDHRHSGLVAGEELFETDAKDRACGCSVCGFGRDGEVGGAERTHRGRVGGGGD
jgi:hypothetical protein